MARAARKKKTPASTAPPDPIRACGVLVAWALGAAAGWQVGQHDLLEGVIRGALVWAGVVTVWMVGCGLGERILAAAPARSQEKGAASAAEEQPAAHA